MNAIGVVAKMNICGILVRVIVNVIRHVKLIRIKKCAYKKCLFGKFILPLEDQIVNTTEDSLDDKKITYEKSNYLIHISLVIICAA